MKHFSGPVTCATVLLALLLPSARMRSQSPPPAPLPDDPLAAVQVLLKTNDELLKRQDDSLKVLKDANDAANEIRIFTRRG